MMIVVMLVSLMVGITFPAVTSGLDSLRLNSAADAVAGAFNMALNRADRRQTAVEVLIDGPRNRILLASAEPGFQRAVDLPDGVRILTILPEQPLVENTVRQFLVLPGDVRGDPVQAGQAQRNRVPVDQRSSAVGLRRAKGRDVSLSAGSHA